jgi:hypothetical protein
MPHETKFDIVYILTNPAMLGLVKIGKTSSDAATSRLTSLSSVSGVPMPFEVYYAVKVKNATEVETALHKAFADFRLNRHKEFFDIKPERAAAILRLLGKDCTDQLKSIKPKYGKAKRFHFLGIWKYVAERLYSQGFTKGKFPNQFEFGNSFFYFSLRPFGQGGVAIRCMFKNSEVQNKVFRLQQELEKLLEQPLYRFPNRIALHGRNLGEQFVHWTVEHVVQFREALETILHNHQ